jgi:cell division protein FtsI/penicillin-binding protein 2
MIFIFLKEKFNSKLIYNKNKPTIMKIKSFDTFQEKKSEKWIQDAIKSPGALRKEMGKKEGEKITSKEIKQELDSLKKKDKDPSKKGVQGLDKKDLKKFRQLNLAKTLKGLKESHDESQNYMFFSNLDHICRMVTEINEMPHEQVDQMLTEHDWASDHMSRSFESISHVYNFLKAMMNGEEYELPDSFKNTLED